MADIGYTLIYEPNTAAKTSINEFKTLLEKSKDDVEIEHHETYFNHHAQWGIDARFIDAHH